MVRLGKFGLGCVGCGVVRYGNVRSGELGLGMVGTGQVRYRMVV